MTTPEQYPSIPDAAAHEPGMSGTMRGLTALPHRGSGTPNEATAADWLAQRVARLGFRVRRQPLRVPAAPSADLIGAALLLGVGALAARRRPALGPLLTALGASWFDTQFSLRKHPLDRLVPSRPSANILASFGQGDRHVILLAHYDTARSMYLYNPKRVRGFRSSFLANAALAHLVPLAALTARTRSGRLASSAMGLYFLANVAMLLDRERREPLVNGANDNATGVAAAIEVAQRLHAAELPGRVTLALTGGEEVGARGARRLAATLNPSTAQDTLVINIDNVGRGELHVATGEGMLAYHPYSPLAIDVARQVNAGSAQPAREIQYRLAYFDALPFQQRGIPTLALIALEDGIIPNWHWPSDTIENVDLPAVQRAADYAEELARTWLGAERTVQAP